MTTLSLNIPSMSLTPGRWPGNGRAALFAMGLSLGLGRIAVPVLIPWVVDADTSAGEHRLLPAMVMAAAALIVSIACAHLLNVHIVRRSEVQLDVIRRRCLHDLRGKTRGQVQRTIEDVEEISHYVRWHRPALLANVATMLAALVAAFVFNPLPTLITALVMATAIPVGRWHSGNAAVVRAGIRQRSMQVQQALSDMAAGYAGASAYSTQRRLTARLNECSLERDQLEEKLARIDFRESVGVGVASAVAVAAMVGLGTVLISNGSLTPGRMIASVLLIVLASMSLRGVLTGLRTARFAGVRLRRTLRAPVQAEPAHWSLR